MSREYSVSIPITGRLEVEVIAESEEEAIKKAIKKVSFDVDSYLAQVDFLEEESSAFEVEEDIN